MKQPQSQRNEQYHAEQCHRSLGVDLHKRQSFPSSLEPPISLRNRAPLPYHEQPQQRRENDYAHHPPHPLLSCSARTSAIGLATFPVLVVELLRGLDPSSVVNRVTRPTRLVIRPAFRTCLRVGGHFRSALRTNELTVWHGATVRPCAASRQRPS